MSKSHERPRLTEYCVAMRTTVTRCANLSSRVSLCALRVYILPNHVLRLYGNEGEDYVGTAPLLTRGGLEVP